MSKVVNYYNEIAAIYDEDRFGNSYGKYIDSQERSLLKLLLEEKKGKILDLACGSGRLLNFADFGADVSSEMLKIAKEKFPEKQLFEGDAEHLPFGNNEFKTVFSFHFFMHLEKEKAEKIIQEVHRILEKKRNLNL